MTRIRKSPSMTDPFAAVAKEFILYKRSSGFKYENEPKCLSRFCRFSEEQGITEIEITHSLAEKWTAPREDESEKSRSHRITCIRQFAIYLNNFGYDAYIVPEVKGLNHNSFVPYIFTHEQITSVIKAADDTEPREVARNMHLAYRDTINIFLDYLKSEQKVSLLAVTFKSITRKNIEDFLSWLETEKKYSISSRNQRLSGLKSFYRYASGKDKTLMAYYQDILEIPKKKQQKGHEIEFFSETALQSILAEPDIQKRNGYRDLVFLILLYDTAARVQEILDVRLQDIHLDGENPYITLHGKGKKTRLVPVMDKTAEHLRKYLTHFHAEKSDTDFLFYVVRKGNRTAMSPDNAEKFIKKYGRQAREKNADVPERLYPHMFRHSRAMHLYRNGMPLPLLAEWLGHAQMETTITYYANADTRMKKEAIEKATSGLNPLFQNNEDINWENDEELLKKLYGLS